MSRDTRKRARGWKKGVAFHEEDLIPLEKWLVAFKGYKSDHRTFIREFFAPGYYEAYDIVCTYAEKASVNILWFKEKSACGQPYSANTHALLESFCTYCNVMFNAVEPIPCAEDYCYSEFCSRECLSGHHKMRHIA